MGTSRLKKLKRFEDLLCEVIEDDLDVSLQTWHEWQIKLQFAETRDKLAEKYALPNAEEDPDYPDYIPMDLSKADYGERRVFYDLLLKCKMLIEKTEIMQTQLTQYEKHCVRFYWNLVHRWTTDWEKPKDKEKWKSVVTDLDIYEIVTSYFNIMRKYGLQTWEEPFYFLSPTKKKQVLFEADMLKRTTQLLQDQNEIHISLLEES